MNKEIMNTKLLAITIKLKIIKKMILQSSKIVITIFPNFKKVINTLSQLNV